MGNESGHKLVRLQIPHSWNNLVSSISQGLVAINLNPDAGWRAAVLDEEQNRLQVNNQSNITYTNYN